MANPFVHVELHTGDIKRAKEFYSKLFDWNLQDVPMPGGGSYTMIQPGTGTGGGMTTSQAPGTRRLPRCTTIAWGARLNQVAA